MWICEMGDVPVSSCIGCAAATTSPPIVISSLMIDWAQASNWIMVNGPILEEAHRRWLKKEEIIEEILFNKHH